MVACTECRAAKVKCNQEFPCKRCLRLGKTCIPHESRQGQNPGRYKRKRGEDDDCVTYGSNPSPEEARLDCALRKNPTMAKDHFALNHMVRQWITLAIKRRSFKLLGRAGNLAAACGMSMDAILCDSGEHRGMDFLHSMITQPSEDQLVIGKTPITPSEVPPELWQAFGIDHNNLEATLDKRWIHFREIDKGVSRFYVSPALERLLGVSRQLMEDTFRANKLDVTRLIHKKPVQSQEKDYMVGFAQQVALHSKPGIPPKPTKIPNVTITTSIPPETELIVDQYVCILLTRMDTSYAMVEYMLPSNHKSNDTNAPNQGKPAAGKHINEAINEAVAEAPDIDLEGLFMDLESGSGDDDFNMIFSLLKDS